MEKLLFIINPYSGKGLIRNKLLEILDLYVKEGYAVTVYTTQGPRQATDVIEKSGKHYNLIVCSGGDGTLNEVVSGVMKSGINKPIGYIPAGSTNDFGASLGISKRNFTAAKTTVYGSKFACDIGQFNDRYFVYVAAFGAFSDVSYETPQEMKNVLGHTAYLVEAITRIHTIEAHFMKISSDEAIYEEEYIFGMITNSTSVGGMKNLLQGEIELNDGLFEVTLIRRPMNIAELSEVIATLTTGNFDNPLIRRFKTAYLHVQSIDSIKWTVDGENAGATDEVTLTNHREAVTFMVPKKTAAIRAGER